MKHNFLSLSDTNAPMLDECIQAVTAVMRSGRYIGGPEVESFERELAAATGTAHAIGTSNGLDALRLIFRALIAMGRLAPGDEVIVPANTYIASILAITDADLVPVLIEPDETTLCIDSSRIEAAITERTRAILTVHLYGRVAFDERMRRIILDQKLILVEDNAQAIGAVSSAPGFHGGHVTGALGHAAAFSFYPTKNIGAMGDAGAVTTDDPELAATVRALANYGSDRRYHNIYQGFNCRLDPIQAAILRVKLRYLDSISAHRRATADAYDATITNPLVIKPLLSGDDMVWHQYVIRHPERDALRSYLADHGVATDIHYATPPHMQPCYKGDGWGPLPITERLAAEMISLPIAEDTSAADARDIATIINSFAS